MPGRLAQGFYRNYLRCILQSLQHAEKKDSDSEVTNLLQSEYLLKSKKYSIIKKIVQDRLAHQFLGGFFL